MLQFSKIAVVLDIKLDVICNMERSSLKKNKNF